MENADPLALCMVGIMVAAHLIGAALLIKDLIRRANTDPCQTVREMYRQLAIGAGERLGIKLEPRHFTADRPPDPGDDGTNAAPISTAKMPVPARLSEYPGECPVCGRYCASHNAWLGHLKAHK